jgi:hypothetical protein
MASGDQLRNYAAQLVGQANENHGGVFNISFVEAGFGLQLECWQFNVRVVIFEIELRLKMRRTNVSLRTASVRQ